MPPENRRSGRRIHAFWNASSLTLAPTIQWSVPINASISKLTAIGSQKVQFQLGGRYWAESPSGGPEDFGVSFKVTFLFPK
jgi:hypothetical protein